MTVPAQFHCQAVQQYHTSTDTKAAEVPSEE